MTEINQEAEAVSADHRPRGEGLMAELQLSDAALEHLVEVMNGETEAPLADDPCIYCTEIRQKAKAALKQVDARQCTCRDMDGFADCPVHV